ncbi:MAG: hypothetical protein JWN44_3900, partial [Myxococcales bacterium]|nr:hypothetical protein [Myxococcales bacterium]
IDYPQSARVVIPRTTEVAFSNDVLLAWNSVRGTSTTSTSLATYGNNSNGGSAAVAYSAVPGIAATEAGWIAFADGLSADGNSADIYLAKTDGTARTRIAAAISVAAACRPQLAFNYRTLVISACASGTTSATVSSVDATTGVVTTIKSGVLPGLQRVATFFLFNDATTSYYTYGTGATAIDKPLQLPVLAGKNVVYAVGRQLRAFDPSMYTPLPHDVALLADAPVQLVASPDGTQLAYWTHAGEYHDLALVTISTGVVRPLRSDFAALAGFTDDSSNLLLLDNVDSSHAGALVAVPLSGAPTRTLAASVTQVAPARASKILFTETGRDHISLLRLADVASDAAVVTLAKDVDVAGFTTDTDRSRVLFSRSKMPNQGLYLSPIP